MSTERLLELKKELETAKTEKAEAEGALKQNLQRLKDEFACKNIESAKLKLNDLKIQKEQLVDKIESAMQKLEETYEW